MNALDGILNQLKTGGWDALNNLGAHAQQDFGRLREEAEREARVVQDCFASEAGQRCLEWLIKKTLLRAPNADEQGAVTAEHFALAAAKRQGQNAIVFMILQALNYKENAS